MKNQISILFLFHLIPLFLFSQQPCLPVTGGIPSQDSFPGCLMTIPVYEGSNTGMTSFAMDKYPCVGFVPHNNTFVSFIADSSYNEIVVYNEECIQGDGLQVIIYDSQKNPISECVRIHIPSVSAIDTIKLDSLIVGERYTIMIDGFNGDMCDFILVLSDNRVTSATDSFQKNNHNSYSIFPNPIKESINIKLNENFQKEVEIKIFNVLGKRMFNNKYSIQDISIPFNHFQKGIYFIEIIQENRRIGTKKLIKE